MTKRVWLFKSGMNAFVTDVFINRQKQMTRTEAGYFIPKDAEIEGV